MRTGECGEETDGPDAARPKPPRRPGRPRADAPARRDAILDAALDLFIAHGVRATTMGDVAARAHASKATLYKLFPSTDALFAAALAREVERRGGGIAAALDAPDLRDALAAAAHAMLDALEGRSIDLFRLVIAEAGRRPDLGRAFYEVLVDAAAAPIEARIVRALDLDRETARIIALQFVGAVKEPLFYPKLMGMPIKMEPRRIVDRAIEAIIPDHDER